MTAWLLASGDFVPLGGMDTANHALASFLARRVNGPVHLVAHRVSPELAGLPQIRVHRVPRPFGLHSLGEPLLTTVASRHARAVRDSGGRVIANGGNLDGRDVTWVHYVHAAYQPSAVGPLNAALVAARHRRYLAAERRALTQAQLVVCNSDRTVQDVVTRIGVDPQRVRRVYYGIDATRFHDRNEPGSAKVAIGRDPSVPLVLFVGALGDRRKGFDTVYAAWNAMCRRSQWDAHLLVAGAGAELDRWRVLADLDGMSARMTFLGYRTDIPSLMAAADLMVHPARYEAYGLAAHEAICCGVPTIVSAAAGVAERFPADLADLLLDDCESAAELCTRFRRWRAAPEELRVRTRAFGAQLRTRSWDDMSREIVDMSAS
ncbi:MAG TPA: glycosyltransferase family 4 protein [Vicinamibacterales bacterium]|jgi:glycosyltransferase involved in cell wall biosynthesis|nr:glycosyltransferase family 4 protein [Vicinamibacterales bacterium]